MTPLEVLQLYPGHDYTLPGLLHSRAMRQGDRPFVLFGEETRTWATIAAAVEGLAGALHSRGVGRGDRIACMATNSDAYVLLFLAICRLAAVLVPVNPELNEEETRYVMEHAAVNAVAVTANTLEVARAACREMAPSPAFMLLDGPQGSIPDVWTLAATRTAVSLPDGPSADDLCLIVYTSGTTGFPKGVMHSQRNAVLAGEGFVERMALEPEDRLLCVLPLFHINALLYSFMGTMAAGASIVLAPRFSASGFWPLAARSGATEVNILAAVGNILALRPRAEFVSGHRLKKIYGSPVSAEVARVFKEEFGVAVVIEGYGMTEVPGAITMPFAGPYPYGSMGLAALHPDHSLPFTELRIFADDGSEAPAGGLGELGVRTPMMMLGYYREPEQTAAAFRDGWFLTGDLVRRDEAGWFYFVSRKKDIIRKRGENISGAEIDRVIGSHPAVAEAAAIPVPSALGDDDILAAVILRPGAVLSAQELGRWCRSQMAAFKAPRYVAFVAELPRTATQRVAKFRLVQDRNLLRNAVDLDAGGDQR